MGGNVERYQQMADWLEDFVAIHGDESDRAQSMVVVNALRRAAPWLVVTGLAVDGKYGQAVTIEGIGSAGEV